MKLSVTTKIINFLSSHRYFVAIFILFSLILGIRIYLYEEPLYYDYVRNALATIRITEEFSGSILLNPHPQAGPFFAIVAQPFSIFTGHSEFYVLFGTQLVFISILFLCLYKLVEAFHSRTAAALSLLILTCFPVFFGQSMLWLHDVAHAAMVTAAIYLSLRPDTFVLRHRSVMFGLTVAFGLLTRFTYPIFVLGGFSIVAFNLLRKSNLRTFIKTNEFKNICIALGLVLAIALPWILNTTVHILGTLYQDISQTVRNENSLQKTGLEAAFYYWNVLWVAIGPHWILPFFLSLLFVLRTNYKILCLVTSIIAPLFLMGFMPVTGVRYIMPVLPFIAAVTAIAFSDFLDKNRISKLATSIIMVCLVGFSFSQHFIQSFVPNGCDWISKAERGVRIISEEPKFRGPVIWSSSCNENVRNVHKLDANPISYVDDLIKTLLSRDNVIVAFHNHGRERASYLRSQITYLLMKHQLLENSPRFRFIDAFKGEQDADVVIEMSNLPSLDQSLLSRGRLNYLGKLDTYQTEVGHSEPWFISTTIVSDSQY